MTIAEPTIEGGRLEPLTREMDGAVFGDRRLERRAAKVLESLASSPKQSINASIVGHAPTAAAYRFSANPKVTSDRILSAHRRQSLDRAAEHSSIRLLQDTSETDFTSLSTLKGAGPLSCQDRRGAFLHTNLMLAPGGLPLGVYDLDFVVRRDDAHGKAATRKDRPIEKKKATAGWKDTAKPASCAPPWTAPKWYRWRTARRIFTKFSPSGRSLKRGGRTPPSS